MEFGLGEPIHFDWSDGPSGEIYTEPTPTVELVLDEDSAHEVVFINSDVEGYQVLIDSITSDANRNVDIYLLSASDDGIQAITATLAGYDELNAIHFVSHGSDGHVNLGSSTLSIFELNKYQDQLATWREHLSSHADMLFYGCDLASTSAGQHLADTISELTGADVAASDDITGHASLGGDWILEYATGKIETEVAFGSAVQDVWLGRLATFQVTTTADDGSVGTFGGPSIKPIQMAVWTPYSLVFLIPMPDTCTIETTGLPVHCH